MTTAAITTEKKGHVLQIGINRPAKRNAFTVGMYRDLARAYGRLAAEPHLRCGLLFAEGAHFTAGLDLPGWVDVFASGRFPELPEDAIDPLGIYSQAQLNKPIVMAVQGICLTIGIELLLATDIRVAAANTRFGQIEIKRGIYPVGGATIRLHQEIGWGNAMRYLLTGDSLRADDALRMGLVQETVPSGEERARAAAIADTISQQAPLGVQATLRSARLARREGELAAMRQLLPDLVPLMQSRDAQEGLAAFTERREAVFQGR
ncbi:MAG: crotonase/enoyl-CoA hydratase family protein [Desulfosarcinaceae bacterium]|nr:crotonase/enoyl-CoA hydratase family protein [Desulfosarcinaceae bacterium]